MSLNYTRPRKSLLERAHKILFRFDAEVQLYGWAWLYWCDVSDQRSPEGDYRAVTDGWLCFQRRYAV